MSVLMRIRVALRQCPDAKFDTVVMSPDTEKAMLEETYVGSYPTGRSVVYGLNVVVDEGCSDDRLYFFNSREVQL